MIQRALHLPAAGTGTFLLWGPRQTGKSKLVRAAEPSWSVRVLDDLSVGTREVLGDVAGNFPDISKGRQVLGFEPLFDLEAGLRRTFAYFRGGRAAPGGTPNP